MSRLVLAKRLNIAGVEPYSSVDWPGRLSATVFLQGCPYRCNYCHNSSILSPKVQGVGEWSEVQRLLKKRKGLLDGIVFSGGDALLQAIPARGEQVRETPLGAALEEVHSEGFLTGLHSSGSFPQVFKALLGEGLVDWVGLDIKALEEDYQKVTGSLRAFSWMERSLETLLQCDVDYETRLTLWSELASTEEGLVEYAYRVGEWAKSRGIKTFAVQLERLKGGTPAYALAAESLEEGLGVLGFENLVVR